jgi:DNA-binding transcriptional regulator YiaG
MTTTVPRPPSQTKAVEKALRTVEARQLAASGAGRMIREAAGLSLAEVGRAIGVDRTAVFYWETGAKRPGGDNAVRYLDFMTQVRTTYGRRPA